MRDLILPLALALSQAAGTQGQHDQEYDVPPKLLKQTRPDYPQEAIRRKLEGVVHVAFRIDEQGQVREARIVGSVPLLDAAALAAVQQWQFVPAQKDGKPVASTAKSPVYFCRTEQGCRLLHYSPKKQKAK